LSTRPLANAYNATAVAREAHATGGSVYDIVLAKGLLSKEKLDQILRPEVLTRPQLIPATRETERAAAPVSPSEPQ
jgi:aspartate ammonia-lyase